MNDFDFKNPDYLPVFTDRVGRLNRIRENPACIPAMKAYYRDNPADFISDWGVTVDPRNVERGLPALIPFILFPRTTRMDTMDNGPLERSRERTEPKKPATWGYHGCLLGLHLHYVFSTME